MLDLKVLRVSEVVDMEKLLHFLDAVLSQVHRLLLFIDDKISCLLNILSHDGVHLGELAARLAPLELAGKNVARLIKLGGLPALSGYDQRSPRLIDENRVDLVDDRIVKPSLYKLLFIDHHIVSQIIKSKLIVRHISDIAVVCRPALIVVHAVQHDSYGKPEELMHLSHPLGITLCQIIVDCDDMDAFSLKGVEICRQCGHQRLTFSCLHLGNPSLMKDDSADQLNSVVSHAERSRSALAHDCICLRQDIVKRLPVFQALFKFPRLAPQLFIAESLHLRA